jgi:hypothetical protein
MHGGADGSGQQTKEGRRRIGAAVKAHQFAFWEAWRQAGKASAPMARKVTYGQAKAKASDAASRPKETRQADDR